MNRSTAFNRIRCGLLVLTVLTATAFDSAAADNATTPLLAAPEGNDAWSGRLERPNAEKTDGPVASLAGARDAVRLLKGELGPGRAIRVVFADGVYPIEEPVHFEPEDSGTAEAPIPDRETTFGDGGCLLLLKRDK